MVMASSGRLDYRTSRFQSWSGVKVNIGEQRDFRLASCPENHLDEANYLRMFTRYVASTYKAY